jgi:hypothetical protein
VCLVQLPWLPRPSSTACIANCISTSRLEQNSGSKTQHPSQVIPSAPPTWGMSRCSTSTSTVESSRAHLPRSEPRGLSHILNPSGSDDTQQHVVSGRSIGAYEENGRLYHAWRRGTYPYPTDEVSDAASPVAYDNEAYRRCSESETDTTWCIISCTASS